MSTEPWRLGRLPICIIVVQLAAACASVQEAPEPRKDALPESFYVVAPWARQPPVNITARFNALNAALSGVQQSIDSYYASVQAQADAHNSRVFLQAELAASQAAERRREEERRAARAQPDSARGSYTTGKIDPKSIAPYKENVPPWTGFEAGTAVVGFAQGWRGWMGSTMHRAAQLPGER